jgi:hypothetical protein
VGQRSPLGIEGATNGIGWGEPTGASAVGCENLRNALVSPRVGFYLRKSVSVGPFRFNLSQSVVGVSAGIKGFRVGAGPRGNYVHMGRGGLYFRSTLPSVPTSTKRVMLDHPRAPAENNALEEIESGSTLAMVDSSSSALLEEINSKAKKMRLWPAALLTSFAVLVGFAILRVPVWTFFVLVPVCCAGIYYASLRDKLGKTVVLFYEMEPQFEASYQQLHDKFDQIRACQRTWHVEARGDVQRLQEWKTSGGASSLIRRKSVGFCQGAPPYFKTNVSVPVIPAGRQVLYFFPDRLLVYAPEGVGAVSYDTLEIGWGESRFIEEEGVPSDARVVDTTWKYVNKKGGPDRRYNDNREIPVALYEVLEFRSSTGLRERFQLSRTGLGEQFENVVQGLAAALNQPPATAANSFVTCPCNNCSGHLEFPVDGMGQTINCPHCGVETILFQPAPAVK